MNPLHMTCTYLRNNNRPHDRQLASVDASATPVFTDTTIEDAQEKGSDEDVHPPDTDEVVVVGEEKGLQVGARVRRDMGVCADMALDVSVFAISRSE